MKNIEDIFGEGLEMSFPVVNRDLEMRHPQYTGVLWVRKDLKAHVEVGQNIFFIPSRGRKQDENIYRVPLEHVFTTWEID
jgi:hypothetical protein